jgi:hypothetical protein
LPGGDFNEEREAANRFLELVNEMEFAVVVGVSDADGIPASKVVHLQRDDYALWWNRSSDLDCEADLSDEAFGGFSDLELCYCSDGLVDLRGGGVACVCGECSIGDLDSPGGPAGTVKVKVPAGLVVACPMTVVVLVSAICWRTSSVALAIGCPWLVASRPVSPSAACPRSRKRFRVRYSVAVSLAGVPFGVPAAGMFGVPLVAGVLLPCAGNLLPAFRAAAAFHAVAQPPTRHP